MRSYWLALALVFALGCPKKTPPGPPPVELAESTRTGPAVANTSAGDTRHVVSYSATRGLVVDDRVVAAPAGSSGFPGAIKRDGEQGLLVAPLYEALADHRGAILRLEGPTPYRLVVELAYTIGQTEADVIEFRVRRRDGEGSLAIGLPRSGEVVCLAGATHEGASTELERNGAALLAALGSDAGRDASVPARAAPTERTLDELLASPESLCLTVVVSARGLHVRSGTFDLDRTCGAFVTADAARSPTLPRSEGRLDVAGLARCANKLAKGSGAGKGRVLVSAEANIPFAELVQTLDALRVEGLAEPALGLSR
jgi:hypothetical protein